MNIIRNIKCLNGILSGSLHSPCLQRGLINHFSGQAEGRKNLFFNDDVQKLLQGLTKKDYEQIFRHQKLGHRLTTPKLKFMTDEELEEARKESDEKAKTKLQMPPVLPPRTEINEVFARDDNLKGYTSCKYIFTDISYGKNDRNRHIVVRDVDGTLRKAKWEERERVNEIYFPRPGRKLRLPQMFKSPYLEEVLNNGWYEFVLNRACSQFEPDDPLYIEITHKTYDKVAEDGKFQDLQTTRHFGPMVFYYTEQDKLEPLLIHYLNYDRICDVVMVIKLHRILHPEKHRKESSGDELSIVKNFINECYPGHPELELALKAYEDYVSRPKSEAVV